MLVVSGFNVKPCLKSLCRCVGSGEFKCIQIDRALGCYLVDFKTSRCVKVALMLNYLKTDVLMIGSGISGLYCALKLAQQGKRVLIVTKNTLTENNSRYAQGGIAAVLPESDDDSIAQHTEDTLIAGAGLCVPNAVEAILKDAHAAIADLLLLGVPFDRNDNGDLAFTLEGGHSARRIIHAGGDATGKQVEMTLMKHVAESENIKTIEHCKVVQLLKRADGACIGADAIIPGKQANLRILAETTILATGGAGRLFAQTTNPKGATGNGFVLAYQAGATLMDMEMVQFHPTAFIHEGEAKFLVSEALRGEGGRLLDADGEPFVHRYDERGDLAPRDVVSRAIDEQLKLQATKPNGCDTVFLDVSHLPADQIEHRFPTILKACEQFGVDIRKQPIPVAPAAHYMMGGVRVDTRGWTGICGLYAIGETVWTGLHGANRLASNSLLECMVVAQHAAETIGSDALPRQGASQQNAPQPEDTAQPPFNMSFQSEPAQEIILKSLCEQLHRMMSDNVGIVRDNPRLTQALTFIENAIDSHHKRLKQNTSNTVTVLDVEYIHQLILARLVTLSALEREESRGAQCRSDFPNPSEERYHTEITLLANLPTQQERATQSTVTRRVYSLEVVQHGLTCSEESRPAEVAVS